MRICVSCLTGMLVCLALAPLALGVDRVKVLQGAQQNGNVTGTTATEVTIEIGATKKQLPVNEIDSVQFDSEPNELTQARAAIKSGRFEDAAANLGKIAPNAMKRPLIAKDVQFYDALASARLALAGGGSIAEAGKKLLAFEKNNRDSFHYFETCEALGDLLVALGNFPVAESYYGKLAEAPWPEYKMRAAVLTGRAMVAQKKFELALARFDQVLASTTSGTEADSLKLAAALGKAAALGGAGKTDEAVKQVNEVIAKADPENEEIYARAYNILGNCYQAAGQIKPAIVAYLHVDLLFPKPPEQHAEALANLAKLFAADNQPEHAARMRNTLKGNYPQSVWANQ